MDFKVVMMGDELRWISLASSGDPIIHMWIIKGKYCSFGAELSEKRPFSCHNRSAKRLSSY